MQCRHIRHIRPHNWNILTFTLSRYDLSEGRTGRQTHAERSPKQYPLVSSNPEGGGNVSWLSRQRCRTTWYTSATVLFHCPLLQQYSINWLWAG